MCLLQLPFLVLFSREIVRQRLGVAKQPETLGLTCHWYLRSDTKAIVRGKQSFVFLDSSQLYSMIILTNSELSNVIQRRKLWRAHSSEQWHREDPCNKADYTTSSIPHGIIFRLSCSYTSNRTRSVHKRRRTNDQFSLHLNIAYKYRISRTIKRNGV